MGNENRRAAIRRAILRRNVTFGAIMVGVNIVIALLGGWVFAATLHGDWRHFVGGAIFTFIVVNVPTIRDKFDHWRKAKAKANA